MISPALPPYIRVIEIKKTPIGDENRFNVLDARMKEEIIEIKKTPIGDENLFNLNASINKSN